MARFNTPPARPAVASPIVTTPGPSTRTALGGAGWTRDPHGELFLLAVAHFVGESTHHEQASDRDRRFAELVRHLAVTDPEWVVRFGGWLRAEGNMRTAPLVLAAEFVKARQEAGIVDDAHQRSERGYGRRLVDAVLQRADEPGELLGYWHQHYGRRLPMPLRRGIGDAMIRLGDEYAYLKWDSEARGVRWADVLNLVHPGQRKNTKAKPFRGEWQRALFGHVVKRPYQADAPIPEELGTLTRRAYLMGLPVEERRAVLNDPDTLKRAGITWEALAGWLQGPMDHGAWSAIIPAMGYMALIRNLRNFDQAGVSDRIAEQVAARITDPEQVRRSRQFPFRFYSAHKAVGSLRWGWALEKALQLSLDNVPALGGRTLVLVDQSPSMFPEYGCYTGHTSGPHADEIPLAVKAALFGSAVALRAESADLVGYGGSSYRVPYDRGDSVLRLVERFSVRNYTDTAGALRDQYAGHTRVVIVTDEQTGPGRAGPAVSDMLPESVPIYTWNLAGYRVGHAPSGSGTRHTFGGLTDAAFRLIPLIESSRDAQWPWQVSAG